MHRNFFHPTLITSIDQTTAVWQDLKTVLSTTTCLLFESFRSRSMCTNRGQSVHRISWDSECWHRLVCTFNLDSVLFRCFMMFDSKINIQIYINKHFWHVFPSALCFLAVIQASTLSCMAPVIRRVLERMEKVMKLCKHSLRNRKVNANAGMCR